MTVATGINGLWNTDVAIAWLATLGVPHLPGVPLTDGTRYQRGTTTAGLIAEVGAPVGRGATSTERPGRNIAFSLSWRGRARTDDDLRALALAAHRALTSRAVLPTTVPAGNGTVRLLPASEDTRSGIGVVASGPQRVDNVLGPGERDFWTCTYFLTVIEET